MVILANIDHLFDRTELTAVPDSFPADKFNSGLMVLQPNYRTFIDMLSKIRTLASPNVGDQGFLNSYFSDWYSKGERYRLPYTYNAFVRHASLASWSAWVKPYVKVLHYSGNGKPWNMRQDNLAPSSGSMDYIWWQHFDEMSATLETRQPDVNILSNIMKPMCRGNYMEYARNKTSANL